MKVRVGDNVHAGDIISAEEIWELNPELGLGYDTDYVVMSEPEPDTDGVPGSVQTSYPFEPPSQIHTMEVSNRSARINAGDALGMDPRSGQVYALGSPALPANVNGLRWIAVTSQFLREDQVVVHVRLPRSAQEEPELSRENPRTLGELTGAIGDPATWTRIEDPGPEGRSPESHGWIGGGTMTGEDFGTVLQQAQLPPCRPPGDPVNAEELNDMWAALRNEPTPLKETPGPPIRDTVDLSPEEMEVVEYALLVVGTDDLAVKLGISQKEALKLRDRVFNKLVD